MLVHLRMQQQARNNMLNNWRRYFEADKIGTVKQKLIGVAPNTPIELGLYQLNQQLEEMTDITRNFLAGENTEQASIRQKDAVQRLMRIFEENHKNLVKSGTLDSSKQSINNLLAHHPKLKSFIKKNGIKFETLEEVLNDKTIDEETKNEFKKEFNGDDAMKRLNWAKTSLAIELDNMQNPSPETKKQIEDINRKLLSYNNTGMTESEERDVIQAIVDIADSNKDTSDVGNILSDLSGKLWDATTALSGKQIIPADISDKRNALLAKIENAKDNKQNLNKESFTELTKEVANFVKGINDMIAMHNNDDEEDLARHQQQQQQQTPQQQQTSQPQQQNHIPTHKIQETENKDTFVATPFAEQSEKTKEKLNYLNDFINEYYEKSQLNNSAQSSEPKIIKNAREMMTKIADVKKNTRKQKIVQLNNDYKKLTNDIRSMRSKWTKDEKEKKKVSIEKKAMEQATDRRVQRALDTNTSLYDSSQEPDNGESPAPRNPLGEGKRKRKASKKPKVNKKKGKGIPKGNPRVSFLQHSALPNGISNH